MYGFEYLKKFLREEGYKIREEEDGHFTFKYQGTIFVVFKSNSPYLQVVVMCKADAYSRLSILNVCNQINSEKYVVKCIAMDDSAWISYEFRPNDYTTNDDFDHILSELDRDSDLFFQKISEQ